MNFKKTAVRFMLYPVFALMLCILFNICAFADDKYDLRTVSTHTPDTIVEYMHPETRHLAADVIRICRENSVSAEFIVSVMRWERRPDLHNWFGWTENTGALMRFSSDIECLEQVIPLIKRNYLSKDGRYFNGYTIDDVSIFYNNSDFWRDTISDETLRVLYASPKQLPFLLPYSFVQRQI